MRRFGNIFVQFSVKLVVIYSEGTAANPSVVIYNQAIDGYVLEAGDSRQHLPLPRISPHPNLGQPLWEGAMTELPYQCTNK